MIDPPTVLVRGPQEVLDRVRAIPTEPSELPTRSQTPAAAASVAVALVQELEGRPVQRRAEPGDGPPAGQARKVYELPDVPVHFLCPPNFTLRPSFIDDARGRIDAARCTARSRTSRRRSTPSSI